MNQTIFLRIIALITTGKFDRLNRFFLRHLSSIPSRFTLRTRSTYPIQLYLFLLPCLFSDLARADGPLIIPYSGGVTVNVILPGERGYQTFPEFEAVRRPNYDHIVGHGYHMRQSAVGGGGTIDFKRLEDYGIRPYDKPVREGGTGKKLIFLDVCQGGKLGLRDGSFYSNAGAMAYDYQRPVLAASGDILTDPNAPFTVTGNGKFEIHMPDGRRIPVPQDKLLNMMRNADVNLGDSSKSCACPSSTTASPSVSLPQNSLPTRGGNFARNALQSGGRMGKNMVFNSLLPDGAEVPAGTGTATLFAANYYGAQAVMAAEGATGMTAGVSYTAGGALTLGGAFTAAVGGVAFGGTGLVQVVRQSPQLGYAPKNGYSTGYCDNFREMYCFWCD